jgi:glycosyltransferase involved in cell wall biosynthesis
VVFIKDVPEGSFVECIPDKVLKINIKNLIMSKKITLIGPLFDKKKLSVGGIVVLFEDLISFCIQNNINHEIIDTNKINYQNIFVAYFKIIKKIILFSRKTNHISLHGTAKDYLFIAPIVVFLGNLFNTPVSLRKFAGSFNEIYIKSNFFSKKIYNYVFKGCHYSFFETKFLVEKFKIINNNTYWWPNSRPPSDLRNTNIFSRKFVYISQVKKTKGIFDLMEASSSFNSDYTFDVYGPIMSDEFESQVINYPNITYKGLLQPKDVLKTMSNYDVLVLPTFHAGEGYPGVILEAFSIGMPVISTKWKAIPEIVKDKYNGILVSIKKEKELVNAINFFDEDSFSEMQKNTLLDFKLFNSKIVNNSFFKRINFKAG